MKRFKIAFESQKLSTNRALETIKITNEGLVEGILSFFQRNTTRKLVMRENIESLKDKKVKEKSPIVDGGRYSGFSLIGIKKINGKEVLKYLESIDIKHKQAINLIDEYISEIKKLTKQLKKSTVLTDIEEEDIINELKKLDTKIYSLSQDMRKRADSGKSTNKQELTIQFPSQAEFDKLVSIASAELASFIFDDVFAEFGDVTRNFSKWDERENGESEWNEKTDIHEAGTDLVGSITTFLHHYAEIEREFYFSLMKYLQASVS